jgi:hypothetical protein
MGRIAKKISRKMEEFVSLRDLWLAIDDMDKLRWNLPEALEKKDWALVDIDTSAHDALKSSANIFSSYLPKISVQPLHVEDGDRAERLERWLEWQLKMVDRRTGSLVWDVMKQSVTYDVFVAQVEYLPYWMPKNKKARTPRQKRYMRGGPFAITPHHPSSVYWEKTPYGLEWVAVAENSLASEIHDYWLPYANKNTLAGKKVMAAIKSLEVMIAEDGEARVDYFDYTDYETRLVYFYESKSLDKEAGHGRDDAVKIVDAENELGFIPWVVSVGGTTYEKDPEFMVDPLVATLHRSGSWKNQNLYESLQTSKVLKSWGMPDIITLTPTGDGKEIDYTGDADALNLSPGEEARPFVKQGIDLGMREIVDRGRGRMQANLGVNALQNAGITGNIQFATFNAQIQIALSTLSKPKRVAEQAFADIAMLFFEWLEKTGDTVVGYRSADAGEGVEKKSGFGIKVNRDEFMLDDLFVTAKMLPNNPTDRMQRMNLASLANDKMHIPLSSLTGDLGYEESPDYLQTKWQEEQLEFAAMTNFIEMQRAQMQLQMAQQQAQQPQIPNQPGNVTGQKGVDTPTNEIAQGQGFDTSQGGSARAEVNPTGQVGLTGRTFIGDELAGG